MAEQNVSNSTEKPEGSNGSNYDPAVDLESTLVSRLAGDERGRMDVPVTNAERMESATNRRKGNNRPSFAEGVKASFQEDQILANIGDFVGINEDPDFEWEMDFAQQMVDGVPERYQDYIIENAVSTEHARDLRSTTLESMENERKLADLGWSGVGIRLGMAMLDPVGIVLSVGTGGSVGVLSKSGRIGRAVKGGLAASTANVATEQILRDVNPTTTYRDVLFAGAAGMALGGVTSGLSKRMPDEAQKLDNSWRSVSRSVQTEELRANGLDLTAKGERQFNGPQSDVRGLPRSEARGVARAELERQAGQRDERGLEILDRDPTDARGAAAAEEQAADELRLRADEIKRGDKNPEDVLPEDVAAKVFDDEPLRVIAIDGESTAGAQSMFSWQEALREDASDPANVRGDAPRSAKGNVRYDIAGRLGTSPNGKVRELKDTLVEDSVGNADGSKNSIGATEWQNRIHRTQQARFYRAVIPEFKKWGQNRGLGFLKREARRSEFMSEVSKAKRLGSGADVSPEAARAAKAIQAQFDEYYELAKNPKYYEGGYEQPIRGFDAVKGPNPNYVPRIVDRGMVSELISEFGDKNVRALYTRAILRANSDLTQEQAEAVARSYVKTIRKHGEGMELKNDAVLRGEDVDQMKEMLTKEGGLDPIVADDIVDRFRPEASRSPEKANTGGLTGRARRRTLLDEGASIEMRSIDGTNSRVVSIEEFYDNDIERLFNMYSRQMSGSVALARSGFRSRSEWDTMLDIIRSNRPDNPNRYTQGRLEEDIKNLEFIYRSLLGIPHETQSVWTDVGQMALNYNFLRVLNQVGFAQLSEIGNTLGHVNWKAAAASVPRLKSMVRDAQSGKLSDDVLEELEYALGNGTDLLRGVVSSRWDNFDQQPHMNSASRFINKTDTVLEYGKRVGSITSGMTPMNTYLQRWSGKAITQQVLDMANGTKAYSARRIASDFGMNTEDLDRVMGQMRKHAYVEDGAFIKKKVKKINLSDWDDPEAAEMFLSAVHRLTRRIVQENDPGDVHRWMGTTLGRILTQFRSFTLVSHSKQLLRGIDMADGKTAKAFSLTTLAAGLGYIAKTHVNSLGREDREEYLEKRLSSGAIAANAFGRSTYAALMPTAIDSMYVALGGEDPVFSYGRTTGLSSAVLAGNPTADLISSAYRFGFRDAPRSLVGAEDFTQNDARNALSLLPFQNAIGIQNATNAAIQGIPDN